MPRYLIVEPHMDDAVLSLGKAMGKRRHEAEMTVLTVSSISNYTSYHKLFRGLFDIDQFTTPCVAPIPRPSCASSAGG